MRFSHNLLSLEIVAAEAVPDQPSWLEIDSLHTIGMIWRRIE
jgi:hypothetical protein